ncbi:hypothetical protein BVI434_140015 [Burkholderia vietnamiensis]|nr:hypothetical protein BVI434_140015 [Burkholderia vietnamiensis]
MRRRAVEAGSDGDDRDVVSVSKAFRQELRRAVRLPDRPRREGRRTARFRDRPRRAADRAEVRQGRARDAARRVPRGRGVLGRAQGRVPRVLFVRVSAGAAAAYAADPAGSPRRAGFFASALARAGRSGDGAARRMGRHDATGGVVGIPFFRCVQRWNRDGARRATRREFGAAAC